VHRPPHARADVRLQPQLRRGAGLRADCGWSNQTSGDLIELGVATLPENAYAAQVGQAAVDSNAVPTYGTPPEVEGFFSQSGGVGRAQVFADGYWIVVESVEFLEPGDAEPLVSAVRGNLAAR
jgi:hypothetical protein